MRVLVYGGGAVGIGIAATLGAAGVFVDIIAREKSVEKMREKGIGRTGIFGEALIQPSLFGAYSSLEKIGERNNYDYILICVKSYDSQKSAEEILDFYRKTELSSKIVLMQNGWGNAEIFEKYFPKEKIFNGRVITGFMLADLNISEITVHADAVNIGSLYGQPKEEVKLLADAMTRGGLPAEVTDSVGKDLWAKMLYNCSLNPLGALFKVCYGKLGESEYAKEIIAGIVKEIYGVMEATGNSSYWETPDKYLEHLFIRQIPATYKHEASMFQDLRAGKKTEIDYLNGQVVRLGKMSGVKTPVNETICSMVKFEEAKN